jgi:hypothetical protein
MLMNFKQYKIIVTEIVSANDCKSNLALKLFINIFNPL